MAVFEYIPNTAKIYCWTTRLGEGAAGHLSLILSDGTTYISHWPGLKRNALVFWKDASQHIDFTTDVRIEGRDPDYVLELPHGMIDETKIKNWWKEYVTRSKYNLIFSNCAQTVQLALREGCIREPHSPLKKVTPYSVYRWAENCVELNDPYKHCKVTKSIMQNYLWRV